MNDDLTSEMGHQMERLTLEDKRQLREFSSTFGANVRQHTVRDKSKGETGCLPCVVSLDLQRREPGSTVPHTSFLGESASSEATDNPLTVQLQYEVQFATRDVVAVKHARRREQFSFFLTVVMKDLLVKSTSATGLNLTNLLKKQWIFFGLITAIQTIVLTSKKLIGITRTSRTQLLTRLTSMSALTTLVLHCTSFHKAKWTASTRIYREDQIVTLTVIIIPHRKKKTIDLRGNVTVPGARFSKALESFREKCVRLKLLV